LKLLDNERMGMPPYCLDNVDAVLHYLDDPEKRKKYLPKWSDIDGVIALFRDEEMREWSAMWPWHPVTPTVRDAAIEQARRGDPSALIDLVKLKGKQKRGRPIGYRMPMWQRERRRPTARAASLVPLAECALSDFYPDRKPSEIRDMALMVVEDTWNRWVNNRDDDVVTVETLQNYINWSKKSRQRAPEK
jgi:hypothetical protein